MELQKLNSVSLSGKEGKTRDPLENEYDLDSELLEKTTQRLSQPGKAFKAEKAQFSCILFSAEHLAIFYGLSTGRVGMFVRDPSKFGNIEDVAAG